MLRRKRFVSVSDSMYPLMDNCFWLGAFGCILGCCGQKCRFDLLKMIQNIPAKLIRLMDCNRVRRTRIIFSPTAQNRWGISFWSRLVP